MNNLGIDTETYKLPADNYYPIEFPKHQIIIGHTFNTGMNHTIGWKTRCNGKYKNVSTFTIDKDGKIYQHYEW